MTKAASKAKTVLSSSKFESLRKFNIFMGMLHLVQAVLMFILSNDSKRDITVGYFKEIEPGVLGAAEKTLFGLPLGPAVASFLLISALAHFYISTIHYSKYVEGLKKGQNFARWYEYALSASVMMVLIAILSGTLDIKTLIAIFGLTAIMNLTGLLMEKQNSPKTKKVDWSSYNLGVLAAIIPWIIVGIGMWASESEAVGQQIPTFVYIIYISLFLFFNCFAINMVLQYKKVGPWKDYLYGEKAYIVLSLVAKTLLAWQVFAGTLQPVG